MEIPYYKVAKEALIKWNGLTEGEADKVISEQTISEIEGQVYAKGSLEYAAEGMMRAIGFNKIDKKGEYKSELLDFIYKGTPSRIIDFISQPLHDSRPISKSQFDKDKAEHHKLLWILCFRFMMDGLKTILKNLIQEIKSINICQVN